MLPGMKPFIAGGISLPTFGVDRFTVSLLKFDEFVTAAGMGAGQLVNDYAKPSRNWTSAGVNGVAVGCTWLAGGASAYSDGSGYSAPADDPDYMFGSGDFTVDFWVIPNNTTSTATILGWNYSYGPWVIFQNASSIVLFASSNATSWDIANGVVIGSANAAAWTHIAIQRKAGVWTAYQNGSQTATFTNPATLPNP